MRVALAGASSLVFLLAALVTSAVMGGAQEAVPPTLALPFPLDQSWRITCGYAPDPTPTDVSPSQTPGTRPTPSPLPASGCAHAGEAFNRYALDLQHSGGSAAATNQPILAAAAGTVARAGLHAGLGWHVIVDHGNGYQTVYGHMIRRPRVAAGQAVEQGAVLGRVGSTGRSTGPHLHFVLWKDGVSVKPEPMCGVRNFVTGMTLEGCAEAPLVVPGDFTGDGADDIVLLTTDPSGYAHADRVDFEDERLSRFGPPTYLPQHLEHLTDVEHSLTGDFDGDGTSDIAFVVVGEYCWSRVDVVREGKLDLVNRKPWWGDRTYCAARVQSASAGDFDGDGLADLALLYEGIPGVTRIDVLRSTGDTFGAPETWWSSGGYFAGQVTHLTSGDFDGDADADLAALYDYGRCETRLHVFVSGDGTLEYGGPGGWWRSEETCAPRVAALASGDVDGDGRVDDIAMLYRKLDGRSRIDSLAAGESHFEAKTLWSEDASNAPMLWGRRSLAAGDFDGVSGTDIVIVRRGAYCKTIVSVLAGASTDSAEPAVLTDTMLQNTSCDVTTLDAFP